MGGTLPAAARGVTRQSDVRRRDVAVLYGLNALGAVAGCLVATFFLLEHVGTRATLWIAAGINLLVAIAASQVDRTCPVGPAPKRRSTPGRADLRSLPPPRVPRSFLLIASAVVGFAFFLMELVWYRMLGPLLGGSVFTFGLILAVALAGIGIGGLLLRADVGRSRRDRSRDSRCRACSKRRRWPASYALGDRLALLTLTLRPLASLGFGTAVACWTLVTMVVVLPAAIVAGYQFPLIIALFGRGRDDLGRQVGLAYAANTLGAIAGARPAASACCRGCRRPARGDSPRCRSSRLACSRRRCPGCDGRAALDLSGRSAGGSPRSRLRASARPGPTAVWRHSGIGAGRAPATLESSNQFRAWMHAQQRAIVWDEDGTESSVALAAEPNGYAFIVNGKSDGSARGDAGTQVMLGLLGAILNPGARRSLVIGLGTGSIRRLARRGSRHGSGRRRRARAADPRRGARVRRSQP